MRFTSMFSSRHIARLTLAAACITTASIAQTPATPAPAVRAAPVMVSALSAIPAPNLPVNAWLSLDANSGQVIAAQKIDEAVEPASITKLMTAYLVFEALESQRLTLEQTVRVSDAAWKAGTGGSRMFIRPNTHVSVHESTTPRSPWQRPSQAAKRHSWP